MDLKQKHEKLLYPVVRCFGKKGAGSGTIVYCKEDPKNEDGFLTFILTNHHVIADLISLKDKWNSLLKQTRKGEIIDKAKVEIFDYVSMSTNDSSNRFNAEIVAYDDHHDLALLKLETPRKMAWVAPIIPEDKIKALRLFMDIAVSGCSMAHEPFVNFGQLTYLTEEIDQKRYFMYNAGSYFGNSGGALFLADEVNMPELYGYLIGVPSRLTGIQLGFGVDMVVNMGFGAHSLRIFEFAKEQHLDFLFDEEKTYYDALDDRKKKEEKNLVQMQAEAHEELQKCGGC